VDKGSRDEFRLYLNKDLDPHKNYFCVGDIVVFERIETGTPIPVYFLYKFIPTDDFYNELTKKIEASPIKGTHALVVGNELNFIPQREININEAPVIIPNEVMEEVVTQQEEILSSEEQNI